MRNRNYFLIIVILINVQLVTSSCDCRQNVHGMVIDKTSKKPIDSVFIYKAGEPSIGEYSDSTGAFKVEAISGGLFGCPLMKIVLKKNGYDSVAAEIDNAGSKIIYLEKINAHRPVEK